MASDFSGKRIVLGIVGALLGAAIGGWLYVAALRQGFYMIALPGAAIGIGCGLLSRQRSVGLGVFCGLLATIASLWLEWYTRPFIGDESFGYFIAHLHLLTFVSKIMIAIGIIFAVWFGIGRQRFLPPQQ